MTDLRFKVAEVTQHERSVQFRMPFRYGVVTLRESPEAYVRVRIEFEDGRSEVGIAADLLAPKWFDKSPELSDADNHNQLRQSIKIAATQYMSHSDYLTAFDHHLLALAPQYQSASDQNLPGLVAGFGQALVDRAILDACCRYTALTFEQLITRNLPGITAAAAVDLDGFDLSAFLGSLKSSNDMVLRHTVGLTDPIEPEGAQDDPGDGLPVSLRENCRHYGLKSFKIKLSGDVLADQDRLLQISNVLDDLPQGYFCTLDGNENFSTAEAFQAFWSNLQMHPKLERLLRSVEVIEQPIARAAAFSVDLGPLGAELPIEIDESDASYAAFATAKSLGYRGVSSKSCKGVYRSLINRARVEKWNSDTKGADYFMTAEDLSTQAGVALQQDLALASLIGCRHVERNGHQYGDGLSGGSDGYRRKLVEVHPDLYRQNANRLDLRVRQGRLSIGSAVQFGYGSPVSPADVQV